VSDLDQMYQQVIMDHAREAHGRGLQDAAGLPQGESHQVNTTCGDEVTMRVALDGTLVASVSWEGQGCSISQASTSVLHDLMVGVNVEDSDKIAEAFRALMGAQGKGIDDAHADLLGDANAFGGVGKYPARIKCALLGWMAWKDALAQAREEER